MNWVDAVYPKNCSVQSSLWNHSYTVQTSFNSYSVCVFKLLKSVWDHIRGLICFLVYIVVHAFGYELSEHKNPISSTVIEFF